MHLDFPFEVKALEEAGRFSGLASVYSVEDLAGDIIEPGAFTDTLAERGNEVPILWAHDPANPVGLGKLTDTERGLHIDGTLDLDVQSGRDAYSRIKKRIVKGLSIGFRVAKNGVAFGNLGDGIRRLSKIDLMEVSLVPVPANPSALVTNVKAAIHSVRDFERFLHQAGFSRSEAVKLASHGWQDPDPDETDLSELGAWLASQLPN